MKALGAILLVIGMILLAIGINDAAVIRARNSQRALMGSYVRDDDSYTTTLIFFGAALFIGGIVMIAVKQEKKVICPYCSEKIKNTAIVCRYCGKDLPGKERIDMAGKRSIVKVGPSGKFFHCPFCNASLDSAEVLRCSKCGKDLIVDIES